MPATAGAWLELSAGVLEPRGLRMRRLGRRPFAFLLKVVGVVAFPSLVFLVMSLVFLLLKACR